VIKKQEINKEINEKKNDENQTTLAIIKK